MTPKPRLTGEPIMRILCKKTDNLVGFLYQWNNGDLQPAWLDDALAEVRYEPIVSIRRRPWLCRAPALRWLPIPGQKVRHA